MGVRPDSPSRSGTFSLLPVAARLTLSSRVGSYVGASGTDTCDSRVFFRQRRRSSNTQSGCPRAEAGITTGQTPAQSNCAGMRLDSTTKAAGDSRVGSYVGASGTDTCDSRVFFRQRRRSSNTQSGCPRAEAGITTGQTPAQSNCAGMRLDSTTKAAGDRAPTSGEETD